MPVVDPLPLWREAALEMGYLQPGKKFKKMPRKDSKNPFEKRRYNALLKAYRKKVAEAVAKKK